MEILFSSVKARVAYFSLLSKLLFPSSGASSTYPFLLLMELFNRIS